MNIFSKENLGGMVNSIGIRQQDCAAIVYMFRYLDQNLECIAFEHKEDFTIHLSSDREIHAQVKVNNIDMKFLKKMIKDYYQPGEYNLFIGSGIDDKVRNLLVKKRKYEESKSLRNSHEAERYFAEECMKQGLVFEQLNEIEINVFDSFNCAGIAKNEINEWADRHCLFVDAQKVFNELSSLIGEELRPYGGVLFKKDIETCIHRHKKSKIPSLNDCGSLNEGKYKIIEEIEILMKRMRRDYDRLNVVKFEIEVDSYLEALNSISELYEQYSSEYKNIYLWLLNMNGQYETCCEIIEKDNCIEEAAGIEYLKALYELKRYTEVIKIAKSLPNTYDVMLYLGRSYMQNKEPKKAKGVFELCIDQFPDKAEVYRDMSQLYQFVSDKAMEYINQAIKIEPQNAFAYLQKGKLKRFKERYEEAVRCFEKYMELSGDYQNEFVLKEVAISLFYMGNEEYTVYFSRWIDRFITYEKINQLLEGEKIEIYDIGYRKTTVIGLLIENDTIILSINGNSNMRICMQDYSSSYIGVYVSPYNYSLLELSLKMMKNMGEEISVDDKEKVIEDAAVPAFLKIYSNQEIYNRTISSILKLNVLRINHKAEEYLEYMISDNDIDVKLIKKRYSLDGVINVGGYIIDIYIPNVGDGYQGFMRKFDGRSAYDEAVILLVSPQQTTQITFNKANIKKIER